jgi:hypothetical protein
MQMYHATGEDALEKIAVEGLRPGSYWSNSEELTRYYAETISDEGRKPRILCIELDALKQACKEGNQSLMPDLAGIEEPITGALGKKEKQIWAEWRETKGTWMDSLAIVSSLKCSVGIGACHLQVSDLDSGNDMRLGDYVDLMQKKPKKTSKPS